MSESSIKNIFKSLSDAERKQVIVCNPASYVSKPKVTKKEMSYWTPEAKLFLKKIDNHRLKIIFTLAIHWGIRMGEILGLRFTDIDLERNAIYICHILNFKKELQVGAKTKTGNRSITISSSDSSPNLIESVIVGRSLDFTGFLAFAFCSIR